MIEIGSASTEMAERPSAVLGPIGSASIDHVVCEVQTWYAFLPERYVYKAVRGPEM